MRNSINQTLLRYLKKMLTLEVVKGDSLEEEEEEEEEENYFCAIIQFHSFLYLPTYLLSPWREKMHSTLEKEGVCCVLPYLYIVRIYVPTNRPYARI